MSVIYYEGTNIHTVSVGPRDRFRFVPGKNDVPDDLWERLCSGSEGTRALMRENKLRQAVAVAEDGSRRVIGSSAEIDISEMSATSAIEIISNEMSVEALLRYREQENGRERGARKTVMEAVTHQMDVLTGPAQAPEKAGSTHPEDPGGDAAGDPEDGGAEGGDESAGKQA